MEFCVDSITISEMNNFVFSSEVEICINLKWNNQYSNDKKVMVLIPESQQKGTRINNRGTCNHKYSTPIYFHSHPISSRAYPSMEDILSVIKHSDTVKCSLIGTRWGIYTIKPTNHTSRFYNHLLKKNEIDKIKNIIKHYIDKIGIIEEVEFKKGNYSKEELTLDEMGIINNSFNKLLEKVNIQIKLYSWKEIQESI